MSACTRALLTAALVVALGGCSHQTRDETNAEVTEPTQKTPAAQVADISANQTVSVHDLPSCLVAAMISSKDDQWPSVAFAGYPEPDAYKAAVASGDGFQLTDLAKAVRPKAEQLSQQLNPQGTPYISFEMDGDAKNILTYQPFWHTHKGFPVNSEAFMQTPLYGSENSDAITTCSVSPLGGPFSNSNDFSYVEVQDEDQARMISALVAKQQVHPRFLLQVTGWHPMMDNHEEGVRLNTTILKPQLIGPEGKVLAESTGVKP